MFGFKHGRLGSAGTRTLIQRAIASLRARGADAHLWLPGGDVKTYGAELVTTQTWTAGYGTTTSTVSVSSGNVTVTNLSPDTLARYGVVISGCVVGNNYKLSASMSSPTGTGDRYMCFTSVSNGTGGTNVSSSMATAGYLTVAGTWNGVLQATATTMYLFFIVSSGSNGATIPVSNITVKEITSITPTITNSLTTGNYLESTGNSVATVNNPVGLVLDALGTVGAELVTNGAGTNTDLWVPTQSTVVSVGGEFVVTATGSSAQINQGVSFVAGKSYVVTAIARCGTVVGPVYVGINGIGGQPVSATGNTTTRYQFTAASTGSMNVQVAVSGASAGQTFYVSNISVREVSGIHAQQGTTANKPVLRRGLTNLLTYSSDFSNAIWSKIGSSVSANATTDPNGGTSATKIIAAATTNWHIVDQNAIPANTPVTFAVYAKAAEETKLAISDYSASTGCLFDLTAVTATVSGADAALTISNPSILSVGDGWYLCSVNMLATATKRAAIYVRQFATSYLGDGTSGVYVYRALLTPGALTAAQILAAGGIPTTTSAAASNPDAGRYSWAFDSTDLLSATIPAGWESATIIDAAPTGAVASVQNVVGTHSLRGAMVTGVNLVTNGDFSSATGWVPGAGWSIGSGVITASNTSITTYRDIGAVTGKTYIVSWDVVTATAGVVAVTVGGAVIGYWKSTAGSFSEVVVAAGNPNVELKCSGFTGSVDNISVYEINPVTHARILVKGTLTDAETNLYKSLANSFK